MGASYKYACPKCEFETLVSGGVSEGFLAVTMTISCKDCEDLHDVGLLERKFIDLPNGKTDFVFKQHRLRCPESPQHHWDLFRGDCPRCGSHLNVDRERPEVLWD